MKRQVVIDTDPGIDDALALLLAYKSRELSLEGVTVVAGNVPVQQGVQNALRVLDLVGADVPVFAGAEEPLAHKLIPATAIHGEDGLGDCNWPTTERKPEETSAVDFLISQAKKQPKKVTLICLGPLTNLALALQKDAAAIANYQEIIIMGGAHKVSGNVTPVAEFNFWADPEAAGEVLDWAKVPVTIIPLDATRKALLTPTHRELLRQLDTPLSRWVFRLTEYYLDIHWKLERRLGCTLNDPLAVAVAFQPELVNAPAYCAAVAADGLCRGQLVVDKRGQWNKRKNVRIAQNVDVQTLIEEFLVRLAPEHLSIQELRKILSEEITDA